MLSILSLVIVWWCRLVQNGVQPGYEVVLLLVTPAQRSSCTWLVWLSPRKPHLAKPHFKGILQNLEVQCLLECSLRKPENLSMWKSYPDSILGKGPSIAPRALATVRNHLFFCEEIIRYFAIKSPSVMNALKMFTRCESLRSTNKLMSTMWQCLSV